MSAFTNIYVLYLQQNRYYIGRSANPAKRFREHVNGHGSEWTRKYKPIELIQIYENQSHYDEDKYVKEYMTLYGIDNVRGGSYVTEYLHKYQIYNLKREIWNATGCCLRCGNKNHYVKHCYALKDVTGESILDF